MNGTFPIQNLLLLAGITICLILIIFFPTPIKNTLNSLRDQIRRLMNIFHPPAPRKRTLKNYILRALTLIMATCTFLIMLIIDFTCYASLFLILKISNLVRRLKDPNSKSRHLLTTLVLAAPVFTALIYLYNIY